MCLHRVYKAQEENKTTSDNQETWDLKALFPLFSAFLKAFRGRDRLSAAKSIEKSFIYKLRHFDSLYYANNFGLPSFVYTSALHTQRKFYLAEEYIWSFMHATKKSFLTQCSLLQDTSLYYQLLNERKKMQWSFDYNCVSTFSIL